MTGRDRPEWIAAKAVGDRAEQVVANWFQERGFMALKTLGNAPFDLMLQVEVEVKRDLKASQTGNVAIETRHNGQPSGVLTSTASYWAIVLDSEAILLATDALRSAVVTGRFREVPAGDYHASTVKLVPVARLKEIRGAKVFPFSEDSPVNG